MLRLAGLVREERRGRQRFYHLEADPLAEVGEWLHPFEHRQALEGMGEGRPDVLARIAPALESGAAPSGPTAY